MPPARLVYPQQATFKPHVCSCADLVCSTPRNSPFLTKSDGRPFADLAASMLLADAIAMRAWMRPVTDPNFDAKAFVAAGYDRCAKDYASARKTEAPPYLSRLTREISDDAKVLDVGCGCGHPIAASLSRRFCVTGIDISREQIKLARAAVPNGTFIHGDATKLAFEEGAFDAAVMLYALFHIPREEQLSFLKKLRSWLVEGGFLIASLAQHSEPGYTKDDFFGTSMYWSNFSKNQTVEVLRRAGFSLVWEGTTGHGYADHSLKPERHPLVLVEAK